MIWTAFIWGLGVSFGASFGLLFFLIARMALDRLSGAAQAIKDSNDQATAALLRRNELTEETNASILAAVETLDLIAHNVCRFND